MNISFWGTVGFLISGCTLWMVWYAFRVRSRGGWNMFKKDVKEWIPPIFVIMLILIIVVCFQLLVAK